MLQSNQHCRWTGSLRYLWWSVISCSFRHKTQCFDHWRKPKCTNWTNTHHEFTYHHTSYRNGEYLEHFLIENGFLCINTRFQKRRGKLWTHTYPNGDRAQLDYMMINKKWINSVQNCEAYYSLEGIEGISTDHRIVPLRIKLSLQTRNNPTQK